MLFKQRRINKLQIKIAKFKALSDSALRFTIGDTNSHFVDDYHRYLGSLAEAETELYLLTNKGE